MRSILLPLSVIGRGRTTHRIARAALSIAASLSLSLTACSLFGGGDDGIPDSRNAWVDAILAAEDARDPADPLLSLALQRDDPVVRMFAYRAFGRMGPAASSRIPLLASQAMQEPVAELRAEAIYAIGGTESPYILNALERFALDPSFVARVAVARALGRADSDQALRPLFDLLSDSDPDVRAEAALGIGRRVAADKGLITARSLPAFREIAASTLLDSHAGVRVAALVALTKTEQPEFAAAFTRSLTDESATVRCFAAVALQTIPVDVGARDALIAATRDADFLVVVEACTALGKAPDPANPAGFLAIRGLLPEGDASGHASHHVRAAALNAIAALARQGVREGARDVVERALADPSPSVRAEALDALVALAPQVPVAEAIARCNEFAAESADPAAIFLRSRAAGAAAALPDDAGLPFVMKLLDDPSPAVRAAAIASLPRFSIRKPDISAGLPAVLGAALADPDVGPREAAATAASELRLESLLPDLLAALRASPGPEMIEARLAILKAIGSFGKFGLEDDLEVALDDEEPEVRRVAAEQIAKLGGLLPDAATKRPPEPPVRPRAGVDFLVGEARPTVEFVTTQGSFRIEVQTENAPFHAAAFLDRCRKAFYDGLTFHRMVPGFVIQGLDPRGDGYGTGGPSLRSELNEVRYDRGVVGTPNAGRDTGGCQMFITFRPQPKLDDRYTVFARVIDGMETVERLDVGDRVLYVLAPK